MFRKICSIKHLAPIGFTHIRVHDMRRVMFSVYVLAVFTVIFDGNLKLAFCTPVQEVTENSSKTFYFGNGLLNFDVIRSTSGVNIGIESFQFGKQATPERISSLVEIVYFPVFGVSAFGEVMSGKGSDNTSRDRSERKTSEFNWHDFFLGFYGAVLASASAIITQNFLSKFT